MEVKLAEYRARKEKQQTSRCSVIYSLLFRNNDKKENSKTPEELDITTPGQSPQCKQRHVPVSGLTKIQEFQEKAEKPSKQNWRDYIPLGLKIILWLCLWKFFIEVGFGAVYFVVSCSYLMYVNTRTEPRQTGQLSAYSVFNPNQERLDGTFTAEQFEKELRMGSGSVR